MRLAERYKGVLEAFERWMPEADTELHYRTDYELLVAVILSAQCTDKRVNLVTPDLFETFPTVYDMARACEEEVFSYISSVSYPNNKAKHLVGMARLVVSEFGGKIPDTREKLMRLPGVGRKTANVMLAVYFKKPAMPVDTHVFRVSQRIGIVRKAKTPEEVETQLVRHIPTPLLPKAHHWLILLGRYVCKARKPLCNECKISVYCLYYVKGNARRQEESN